MAINVPGDLILDVMRAADPAAVQKAEAMLESAASARARNAAATGAFTELASLKPMDDLRSRLSAAPAEKPAVPEAYRKFEGMVLQQFIQQMLPDDSEGVFGKGTAGEIWKGMMAEQIGSVIAAGGGIGIADRMLTETLGERIRPDEADLSAENTPNRAASLINTIERDILGRIGRADNDGSGRTTL